METMKYTKASKYNIYKYLTSHETNTYPPTLSPLSLKLSQSHVGVQSLGKRMRSFWANGIAQETGAGGRERMSTARALCLYSIVSLILSIIILCQIYKF